MARIQKALISQIRGQLSLKKQSGAWNGEGCEEMGTGRWGLQRPTPSGFVSEEIRGLTAGLSTCNLQGQDTYKSRRQKMTRSFTD